MILDAVIDFVYPKVCAGCQKWGVYLCSDCRERLDFADQICPMCGESEPMGWTHPRCKQRLGMDGLIVIYEYQEPVMNAVIDEIKYGFNRELIGVVLDNFVFESGIRFDYLVPVPLYYYRENWRGFNQAEKIAQELAGRMSVPIGRILKRNRNTKQQVTMKSKEEREKNISGAIEISRPYCDENCLMGKNILLVDDVFTSGADMRECTKVLKKADVGKVWGLALAH